MKPISDSQIAPRRRSGMTLVEILISSLIASVVLAIVATLTIFATRSVLAMTNYTELDQDSRNTLDLLSRDIRQASSLTNYSATMIQLKNTDNTICTYTYNKSEGRLYRKQGTYPAQVVLQGCDFLTFKISKRNPSNDFTFFPATIKEDAKLIDVSWKCSREIKAQKVNTESIQTAKIVMRN